MIPIYKPYLTKKEKVNVKKAISTGWVSSNGSFVKEFEEKFADFVGSRYAISTSNGTCALQAAIQFTNYNRDKITKFLIPDFCYIAIPNSIHFAPKKEFILGDIDKITMNLAIEEIEKNKENIDGIVFVYNYGNVDDIERIKNLCFENNIFFIEDACEAFGTKYKNRSLGTFGNVGVFSFFGNKTITTGEGGMIVTDDKEIYDFCMKICRQGVASSADCLSRYDHSMPGYNFRMTNLQAAIGVAQIDNFETIREKKEYISNYYFNNINPKYLFPVNKYNDCSYFTNWLSSIKSPDRDSMILYLREKGIETRPFFKPVSEFSFYSGTKNKENKNSKEISNIGLNIPSFPELTKKELKYICGIINAYE